MGAVHVEIEHLLNEDSIRNPGYFAFANTLMLLCWKHYTAVCSWGGSVCENEISWISYVTFIQ